MFRKLMKNKKAQQTAEYALLISLVVAAIIAMQTYAQRTIQARIRDAAVRMVNGTEDLKTLGSTMQYEPYYLERSYETFRNETTDQIQEAGASTDGSDATFDTVVDSTRTKAIGGFQVSTYNNTMTGIVGGI